MLTPEVVVLSFVGFCHKKSGLIIKELLICSNNYSYTILFLPPVSYNSLSASERKSHHWVCKFCTVCRGIVALIPFWFPSQVFIAIKLQYPSGKIYAEISCSSSFCFNLSFFAEVGLLVESFDFLLAATDRIFGYFLSSFQIPLMSALIAVETPIHFQLF